MFLTLPAEVVRIAYAFQVNAVRPTPEGAGLLTAARYILCQPDDGGVLVFSCDGSAVCGQWAEAGEVDEPCTLAVVPEIAPHIAERTSQRWVVARADEISVYADRGAADHKARVPDREVLRPADIHPNAGPTNATIFPDWGKGLAKAIDDETWHDGIPSEGLSLRHFGIIGNLWQEWPDARSVQVRHSDEGHIAVRFPSRPDMLIFIAKDAPFCQPVEEEDPAAGL